MDWKKNIKIIHWVFFIGLIPFFQVHGQFSDSALYPYEEHISNRNTRTFNVEKWSKFTDEHPYSEYELVEKQTNASQDSPTKTDLSFLKIPLTLLVIFILSLLLFFLLRSNWPVSQVSPQKVLNYPSQDSAEEHLDELEERMKKALFSEDYKLAIRISYLMVIRELDLNKLIKWRKDKSNIQYLRELTAAEYQASFRTLTTTYERVWFGDIPLDYPTFEYLHADFKTFLQTLHNPNA